jgi:predicted transcriptional regulator
MAKFKLEFTCDTAAFDDDPGIEIARILREVATWIDQRGIADAAIVRDINGNTVGKIQLQKGKLRK